MKALFITFHYLDGNGGGVFASRAYLNSLARLVDKLDVICPMKEGHVPAGIDKSANVILVYNNKPKFLKFIDLLIGVLHRHEAIAKKVIAENKYDFVVFDSSQSSWRLIDYAHQHNCKVVVIHHNFEKEYARDNYHGLMKLVQEFWVPHYEGQSVIKSDLNLTLTRDDLRLLRDTYDSDRHLRFDVLGTFEYQDTELIDVSKRRSPSNSFVITGSLSATQTYESLKNWIDEYYPVLLKTCVGATLTIAGKAPSQDLIKICNEKNIKIIPSPKSMEGILLSSKYYICPVNLGGGIKLRIMDGLKSGLPVLTHDVSVRGYEMYRDRYVIGYHDKESFAKGVTKMVNTVYNPNSIQKEYSDYFSFSSGSERFKAILKRNNII